MNKIIIFLLTLIPAVLSAQTTADGLSMTSAVLQPDAGSEARVTVSIEGTEHIYTGYQMDITLPEGIELCSKNGNYRCFIDKNDFYPSVDEEGEQIYSHSLSFSYGQVAPKVLRIACSSTSNENFTRKSGRIFYFYVKATTAAKPGAAPLVLSNCKFITYDAAAEVPTVGYTVQQTAIDGIGVSAIVNISSAACYATLMLPYAATLPAGLQAFTCNSIIGDKLVLNTAETIEAYKPYIIYAENGYYGWLDYTAEAERPAQDVVTEGLLNGAVAQQTITSGYVLQNGASGTMFYQLNGNTAIIPRGKCWVTLPSGTVATALGFQLPTPTAIDVITAGEPVNRIIHSISGQRVNAMLHRGIYIINGKKIVCQ